MTRQTNGLIKTLARIVGTREEKLFKLSAEEILSMADSNKSLSSIDIFSKWVS
jgi:hypothetical protein